MRTYTGILVKPALLWQFKLTAKVFHTQIKKPIIVILVCISTYPALYALLQFKYTEIL